MPALRTTPCKLLVSIPFGDMNWSDAHGVSYLAWAWNVGRCIGEPSLISSYAGIPTRTYGQGYRDHLARLHRPGPPPAA